MGILLTKDGILPPLEMQIAAPVCVIHSFFGALLIARIVSPWLPAN
jgi:hypothetical protein